MPTTLERMLMMLMMMSRRTSKSQSSLIEATGPTVVARPHCLATCKDTRDADDEIEAELKTCSKVLIVIGRVESDEVKVAKSDQRRRRRRRRRRR
jgi:hypothetical protein